MSLLKHLNLKSGRLAVWVLMLGGNLIVTDGSAQVFFTENFDGFADNAAFASGGWVSTSLDQLLAGDSMKTNIAVTESIPSFWGIQNFGGRPNPFDRNGNFTSGNFLVSDSDAAGGADQFEYDQGYVVTSPPFSCAASATVWYHAPTVAILNDNSAGIYEIWASNDGGTNWTNVERFVAPEHDEFTLFSVSPGPSADATNANGTMGVNDVDLSSVFGNQADCRLRFVHRQLNDEWYVLIDDLVVDANPPPTGATELLANESFDGLADGAVPAGWTVGSGSGVDPWGVYAPGNRRVHITEGPIGSGSNRAQTINRLDTTFVIRDGNRTAPGTDEFLDSPSIATNGNNLIFVEFEDETLFESGSSDMEVFLSIDGGATFLPDPILNIRGASFATSQEQSYTKRVIPTIVPDATANIALRFAHQGNGYWAIDNIRVSGSSAAGAQPAKPSLVSVPMSPGLVDAFQNGINFETSPFDDQGATALVHTATPFQIIKAGGNFDSPLLTGNGGAGGDLTMIAIASFGKLGDFEIRVRHVADFNGVSVNSEWSDPAAFNIGGIGGVCLLDEDFESVTLEPASQDPGIAPGTIGFTHNPPTGWSISTQPPHVPGAGCIEWDAWTFTTTSFWLDADGQGRAAFTIPGNGIFAVADSDEYDDCGGGPFDSTLTSPPVTVPGGQEAFLLYDVDWRNEGISKASVTMTIDGGAEQNVLLLDSSAGDPDLRNSSQVFPLPMSANDQTFQFRWRYFDTSNNWWFATDNVAVCIAGGDDPSITGYWCFDNGDLVASIGDDMQYFDGPTGATQAATVFDSTTNLPIPDINGQPANVMGFPANTSTMGYIVPHGVLSGNGGGGFVNDYTLIYDYLYPASSTNWKALFQTSSGNSNDGDAFIRSNASGGPGIGIDGVYDGNVAPDTWYRIVITLGAVPAAGGGVNIVMTKYLNGFLVGQQINPASAGLDGRFSLNLGNAPVPLLILTDNDGDTDAGYLACFQFRNNTMQPIDVFDLGGPDAAGIPTNTTPTVLAVKNDSWVIYE